LSFRETMLRLMNEPYIARVLYFLSTGDWRAFT